MSQQPPDRPTQRWQQPQPTQPLAGWGQQPTQPQWGPPPGGAPQQPPGPPYGQQPYGQQPAWGPQPPQGPPQRRPWYQRWWAIGAAGFLLGAIVTSAGSGNQEPQTATKVTERTVWTPECEKIQNQTERGQCERIMAGYNKSLQSATTVAPATTRPKATTPPAPTYTDGVYEVGSEIKPGTYKTRAPAGDSCYWARLGDPDGDNIHANHIGEGPMTLRIRSSDKFVELNGGCEWRKVG
jgi:hypothetical protein